MLSCHPCRLFYRLHTTADCLSANIFRLGELLLLLPEWLDEKRSSFSSLSAGSEMTGQAVDGCCLFVLAVAAAITQTSGCKHDAAEFGTERWGPAVLGGETSRRPTPPFQARSPDGREAPGGAELLQPRPLTAPPLPAGFFTSEVENCIWAEAAS